jgi:hypothetical protein
MRTGRWAQTSPAASAAWASCSPPAAPAGRSGSGAASSGARAAYRAAPTDAGPPSGRAAPTAQVRQPPPAAGSPDARGRSSPHVSSPAREGVRFIARGGSGRSGARSGAWAARRSGARTTGRGAPGPSRCRQRSHPARTAMGARASRACHPRTTRAVWPGANAGGRAAVRAQRARAQQARRAHRRHSRPCPAWVSLLSTQASGGCGQEPSARAASGGGKSAYCPPRCVLAYR